MATNYSEALYSFNILVLPVKKFLLSQPKLPKLHICPEKLIVNQKVITQICYEDIQSIELQHGVIRLVWSDGKLEFKIPSTLGHEVTDEEKADLLIKLVLGVKNKVDINPIVEAVKEDELRKKTKTICITAILLTSLFSFAISLVFYGFNNGRADFLFGFFGFLGLAGLFSLIPASIIRSRSDFKFSAKLIWVNYHYAMAVAYLDEAETKTQDLNEQQEAFLFERAQRHLEKIIDIDPSSQLIEKLRARIF